MRSLLLGCALAFVTFTPAIADDDEAKKELKALQGTWKVVAAEQNGDPLDRIVGGVLVIKDNNFSIKTASGTEMKGDLILAPAKKPKHINLAHQEGLLKDKTWKGIYELKGDSLKLIYAEADSGKDRPTEFKTLKKSGLLLVELKREKK
ncbi:MAG: TIGR03067 domain-containing protein [Planctomycetia bacterium]|nr:TIGR03067 domain-containing protein [Planctomycetia bacterium]